MSAPMTKAELLALARPAAPGIAAGNVVPLPARLLARFKAWNTRRSTALALEALPEGTLRDIGLTRGEIDRAAEQAAEAYAHAA